MLLYRAVTMLYGFCAWQAFSKSASCANQSKFRKWFISPAVAGAKVIKIDWTEKGPGRVGARGGGVGLQDTL